MIQQAIDDQQPTTSYFTFAFGEDNAGWFELSDDGAEIAMCATFEMDGERYDNPFALRYADGAVTAYRVGDGLWTDNPDPERVFPSSAYPLLLPRVADVLRYDQLNEGSGEIVAGVTLTREGDEVVERKAGAISRRFLLRGDEVVRIDWGGPVSERRASLAEARAGSPFA